jgi:hypothetical protein
MNERIRQLAEQATSYNNSDGWLFDKEKFAELIVAECISKLEEKIHRSIDNEGDEIWADLILKEHFGVEE